MAEGLNDCNFIGNLGRDPELRYTANGTAVATFSIGVSRSWLQDGNRKDETEWVNIVAWSKLAETLATNLTKGRKVYVSGRLSTRSWEKDGEKKYRTEVVAEKVLFLDTRGNVEGGGNARGSIDMHDDIDPEDLPFD